MGEQRKRIGLALGGGGARGMAHVGVIRVLEQAGIPIDCIAGVSAGSVVGAAYAAGIHDERLMDLALHLRWRQIARLIWPREGFVSFDRLESYLIKTVGDLTFADLHLPYAAVAADLATGKQVVLKSGRVAPAVRASCSVPGIVTPLEIDGVRLVDGGIVNNLPISVVRDLGADVVIAVGLGAPPNTQPKGIRQILSTTLEHILVRIGDDPGLADVYLPIPVSGLGSFMRTSQRRRFIALGRQVAEAALPAIRAALD